MEKKGQISAEFLVILGVVLVVALVAVGLTLLFSQTSRDITENDARAYWSSQPNPLRIDQYQGYYYPGVTNGELAVVVENVDTKPITLRSFVLEPYGTETSFSVYDTHSTDGTVMGTSLGTSGPSALTGLSETLAPSEKMTLYLRTSTLCTDSGVGSANSNTYEDALTIYYDTPYFTGLSFKGVKDIKGRCNEAG